MPDYLIDMCISIHLAHPLMYRNKKVVREGLLATPPQAKFEELVGLVSVSPPPDVQEVSAASP